MSQCLLTVTCDRDRWSFIHQYYSVNKYIKPCTWYIVINELEEKSWLKFFKKHKEDSPHDIKLIPLQKYLWPLHPDSQKFIKSKPGYWRQLYCKLLIHLHCKEKRIVVLDSKNWIAKKCKLSDFPQQRLKSRDQTVFRGTIEFFQKFWKIDTPFVTDNITPYILYKKTLASMWKEFHDVDAGIGYLKNKKFISKKTKLPQQSGYLAEFFMYDIFCQKKGLHQHIVRDGKYPDPELYAWFDPSKFENKDQFINQVEFKNSRVPPLSITIKWYVENEGGSLNENHRKLLISTIMKEKVNAD
tara:strand:- start:590 stop:1486 length:897 start_codon:yes stop_codon:yes gene_type:complete